jgi:hypothetical protein
METHTKAGGVGTVVVGMGTMRFLSGEVYGGYWKDGVKNGQGIMT